MRTFRLPDIGEGLAEAEIVTWHVGKGDRVVADQPLVSIETEKAVVEIPSPWTGTIALLHHESGDIVPVGSDLVSFADDGEVADRGAIVGDLAPAATEMSEAATPVSRPRSTSVRAVPAARQLARLRNLNLADIRGTGPDGTILAADVEAATVSALPEGYEPLRGPRRAMAKTMQRAGEACVPASVTDHTDISGWWSEGADITVRLVQALVVAAGREPALNTWFDGSSRSRRLFRNVDVGLAVDTSEGLLVPVVRAAESLDTAQIRTAIDDLVARARDRTLRPDELAGPTITLSNFGMIAGQHASLVIVPPQVAIVGAGRVESRLVLEDGAVTERWQLPLSLTFDHRAVTGGEAARFMAALRDALA